MICCSSCAWLLLVKEEEKRLKSEEELHKTKQNGCPNPEFITVIPLLPLLPPPRRFWSILTIFDQVVWPSRLVLGKKFFWIWFVYALEGIVLAWQFFFDKVSHLKHPSDQQLPALLLYIYVVKLCFRFTLLANFHFYLCLRYNFHMSHSQMLGKFEYTLPAKFWRLVGCTEMLSW